MPGHMVLLLGQAVDWLPQVGHVTILISVVLDRLAHSRRVSGHGRSHVQGSPGACGLPVPPVQRPPSLCLLRAGCVLPGSGIFAQGPAPPLPAPPFSHG